MHDFALAGDFIVVFVSPYMASYKEFGRALLGLQPLGAAYAWHHDRPTRVRASRVWSRLQQHTRIFSEMSQLELGWVRLLQCASVLFNVAMYGRVHPPNEAMLLIVHTMQVLIFRKSDLSLACELEVTPPVSFYHFINAWQRPGT